MDYSKLSKEQLVIKIFSLEEELNNLKNPPAGGEDAPAPMFDMKEFGDMFGQFLGMDFSQAYNDYINVMIENLSVPVYFTDTDNIVLGCNRGFEQLVNREGADIKQQHLSKVITEDFHEREMQAVEELMRDGKLINYETTITDSAGTIKEVVISKSIFKNLDGTIAGIIGVINDITEKRAAERALVESERKLRVANATKDKFFSIIAHDLKSPFAAILGISEVLHEGYSDMTEAERKSFISDVSASAQKAYKLVENLLAWGRSQLGQITLRKGRINIGELIRDLIELYAPSAKQFNVELLCDINGGIFAFADRDTLAVVFRNLINNGVKFNKDGGKVTISASENGDRVSVRVRDNGIGMRPADLDILFRIEAPQKIGNSPNKGSGLGLILCREFLEKNNGAISVASELGAFTEFTVTLPKG